MKTSQAGISFLRGKTCLNIHLSKHPKSLIKNTHKRLDYSKPFKQSSHFISIVFVVLFALQVQAQDTTYYDTELHRASRAEASFFFIPPSGSPSRIPSRITDGDREITRFQFAFPPLRDRDLIGKNVAIWSLDKTYSNLHESLEPIDWPADDSIYNGVRAHRKKRSVPCRDTAKIVWIFQRFQEQSGGRVYIVKACDDYTVIGGSGLTMPDVLKPPPPPSPPQPPPPLWLALHTGLLFQSKFAGDLSVMLANEVKSHDIGAGFHGWKTGIEMTRTGTIGYKFGYDFDLAPFGIRGDLLAIPTGHRIDWRAVPQIGINLMYISLTYGYAFRLVGPREHDFGNHRASLSIYTPLLNLRRSGQQGS